MSEAKRRFKYFVCLDSGVLSHQTIMQSPVGYAFRGLRPGQIVNQMQLGPEDLPGQMLAWPDDKDGLTFNPENENWVEVQSPPDAANWVRCFVGYPKNTPYPTPINLVRPDVSGPSGVVSPLLVYLYNTAESFADGQNWSLPTGRLFREDAGDATLAKLGLMGKWLSDPPTFILQRGASELLPKGSGMKYEFRPAVECPQEYRGGHWSERGELADADRRLWDIAMLTGEKFQEEDQIWLTSDEAKNIAVEALQAFYLVGTTELSMMKTLKASSFRMILAALCDYYSLINWVQKKTEPIDSEFRRIILGDKNEAIRILSEAGTSYLNSGQMENSPSTDQPIVS